MPALAPIAALNQSRHARREDTAGNGSHYVTPSGLTLRRAARTIGAQQKNRRLRSCPISTILSAAAKGRHTCVENLAHQTLGARQLRLHGQRTAVVCDGRQLSYAELAKSAVRAARHFVLRGLRRQQRVALLMRDTPELIAAFLGAMRVGAIPLIVSPRASSDDLAQMLADSAASLLVYERCFESVIDGAAAVGLVTAAQLATRPQLALLAEAVESTPEDEAFWVFSSGSTGRSKGIVHRHAPLDSVTGYHRDVLGVTPGDRVLCTSRLSFAYALGNGMLVPLALGATVVLHPDWPTPQSTLATIAEVAPKVVFATPSLYRAWLNLPAEQARALDCVQHFVSAGEKMPVRLLERWHQRHGKIVHDCYGCSETVFFVFASTGAGTPAGSVGKLTPGSSAELRSTDGSTLARHDQVGRVYIRHPFLATGYGPRSSAQQHRFSDGWFETGDLFRCDSQGHWTHSGRDDDLLKIAGQWVNLREIEEVAGECADVGLSAAVAMPDEDGLERIAIFVTLETEDADTQSDQRITDYIRQRLPRHKWPKWIRIIKDMPRTTTGKIHKRGLDGLIAELGV